MTTSATPRAADLQHHLVPWHTGRSYIRSLVDIFTADEVLVCSLVSHDQAEIIVHAVNTFDQAKAALRDIERWAVCSADKIACLIALEMIQKRAEAVLKEMEEAP